MKKERMKTRREESRPLSDKEEMGSKERQRERDKEKELSPQAPEKRVQAKRLALDHPSSIPPSPLTYRSCFDSFFVFSHDPHKRKNDERYASGR